MSGLDGGRLNIGSCSLGAAQACFEIALNYVKVWCYYVVKSCYSALNEGCLVFIVLSSMLNFLIVCNACFLTDGQ